MDIFPVFKTEVLKAKLAERQWDSLRFAAEVEVSPTLVSMWLNQLRSPGRESLKRVLEVLGCSKEELIEYINEPAYSRNPQPRELKKAAVKPNKVKPRKHSLRDLVI